MKSAPFVLIISAFVFLGIGYLEYQKSPLLSVGALVAAVASIKVYERIEKSIERRRVEDSKAKGVKPDDSATI